MLTHPLWMLDFETCATAVPLFDGTRPYQQVPFQFSLHKVAEDGTVQHVEYLWEEDTDPRPGLVEALKAITDEGTVLAFNASFEKRVIRELAEAYPDEEAFLLGLNQRMDDLIIPFRQFWLYDPAQHGSCSIKKVLPALTETSYDGMDISKGDQAAREWRRAINGAEDKEAILEALRKYCEQDTQAMIDIMNILKSL